MTADIICYACTTWSGGSLDVSSTSAPWMWAAGPGTAVSSDSQGASIQQHRKYGSFALNMVAARQAVAVAASSSSAAAAASSSSLVAVVASSQVSASAASTTTATPSAVLASTTGAGSFPAITTAPPISTGGVTPTTDFADAYNALLIAHAVLLPLTFLLLLPLGVLLLRLSSVIPVRLHYITQTTALVFSIVGLAIAIAYSSLAYGQFNTYHQIIGIVAVILLFGQAVGGVAHHLAYKRRVANSQGYTAPQTKKKSGLAIAHIWFGRAGIALGMVNVALGFLLAGERKWAIAIGVVSAVIYCVVAVVVLVAKGRGSRRKDIGRQYASESDESVGSRERVEKGVARPGKPGGGDEGRVWL